MVKPFVEASRKAKIRWASVVTLLQNFSATTAIPQTSPGMPASGMTNNHQLKLIAENHLHVFRWSWPTAIMAGMIVLVTLAVASAIPGLARAAAGHTFAHAIIFPGAHACWMMYIVKICPMQCR